MKSRVICRNFARNYYKALIKVCLKRAEADFKKNELTRGNNSALRELEGESDMIVARSLK
jgi:hypothetical protein